MTKPKPEPGRSDYAIDRRTFIAAWESSGSPNEVFEKLAEKARKMKLDPMPLPVILARASTYRRAGLDLKKFKPGRKAGGNDLAADQELLEKLKAERAPEVAVDPALVDAVVEELIRRLRRTS